MAQESFDPMKTRIGPSPESQRRKLNAQLQEEGQRITATMSLLDAEQTTFREKYGEDLGDSAKAYAERTQGGNSDFVYFRGTMVDVGKIRPLFAKALTDKLESQPTETRANWMNGFLADLDKLVPPKR